MRDGLIYGLIFGLMFGLVFGSRVTWFIGVLFGLGGGLGGGLLRLMTTEAVESSRTPNRGTLDSIKDAFFGFLIVGLPVGWLFLDLPIGGYCSG